MDFLIGGIAGAGATIATNPVDVVKTRLQLQGELRARNEHQARYRGMLHALYVIARTDGLLAVQKGLAPAMVFGFIVNSVRLGVYRMAESRGWTKNKNGEIVVTKAVFWSTAGGALSGVVGNPASVVKTRIQTASHPTIAVGRQHVYNGTFDAFKKIYRHEGMQGLFAGLNATCVRLAVGSMVQLTTFSTVKQALLNYGICKESPFGLAFMASMISGVAVVATVCPIDVTAVRLYNQGKSVHPGFFVHIFIFVDTVFKISCEVRVKEYLLTRDYVRSSASAAFIASLVCGVPVVLIGSPIDVINTRLYNQGTKAIGEQLYTGIFDCFKKIYQIEGIHGLYKGLGPLYLRLAPHTTISLVIWDMLNDLLISNKNS